MMSQPVMQLIASSKSAHVRVHSLLFCNIARLFLAVRLDASIVL